MINNPFLPEFDGFSQLWQKLSTPDIHGTALEHILQNSPNLWDLKVLDTRVSKLLQAEFDLSDAGGSFFKPQQTWREWDKGVSEVSVLSLWSQAGLLQDTAYPIGSVGTAPFDACLLINGLIVPGDIKTATTAASGSILEHIEPAVAIWASDKGIKTPEIELHIDGSLDQRRLNPKWGEIQNQVKTGLATLTSTKSSFLISVNCPLPGDQHDPPSAGALDIQVKLLPHASAPTHTWSCPTMYVDHAGNFREPSVEFARSLLEKHADKKNKYIDPDGLHPPFILAYHRRSRPGDLRPEHVAAAMHSANGPQNWLGVLYVDELTNPIGKSFHLHQAAAISGNVDPAFLKKELER